MESYSQNSNKLDFQHEARILNGIWLITALGLVTTAGLAWGAKYLHYFIGLLFNHITISKNCTDCFGILDFPGINHVAQLL